MTYGHAWEKNARGSNNVVGVPFTVPREFTSHKARQQTYLLHLSVHHVTKWTHPCLWLWSKEWNIVSECVPSFVAWAIAARSNPKKLMLRCGTDHICWWLKWRSSVSSFLVSWGGVRLSPLGMPAANWPTVPAMDDRWVWSISWNENWQGKPKYSEETCPSATLSTTYPDLTWDQTRATMEGSRWLTAWAMAWPRSGVTILDRLLPTRTPKFSPFQNSALFICEKEVRVIKS
jgi:hypothetical protein